MLIYIIFFVLLIIIVKNQLKAALVLLITYPTIAPLLIGEYSIHTILTFLLFFLWCFKFRSQKHNKNDFFNFKWVFIICFASYLISSFHDLSTTSILNILGNFTFFMLVFIIYKDYDPTEDVNKFYILLVLSYISILLMVGTYEAISTGHPYGDFLSTYGVEIPEASDNSDRTGFNRAQSLTVWCEAYGAVLILGISTICCLQYIKQIKPEFGYFFIFFSLFGALTTNSRTIFVGAILSAFALLPLIIKKKKSNIIVIAIFALIFFIILSDVLLQFFDILINHEDSGGSSLVMRLEQFAVSMFIISDNLLFGAGLSNVYSILIDYKDIGLNGAESVVFTTLLGRGLFGLFTLIVALVVFIRETIKNNMIILLYMIMAFTFIKICTLCHTIHEFYILGYYIPLFYIINRSNNYFQHLKDESTLV